jgi:digeranylgeranylglycerophospholipid reductase
VTERYDVAIVGGGPIGAATARHAADAGARVLLVEKGDGSGEPARCAGLVSPRTLETLGASDSSVLRIIRGGTIHSPADKTFHLRAGEARAVVIDRGKLNRELLALAAQAGVDVRINTRAVGAKRGILSVGDNQDKVSAGVIVGADGPQSIIASCFSLSQPPDTLIGSQAIVAGSLASDDEIEIFFGNTVAPTFFAWVIPAEAGQLRVGLAAPLGTDTNKLLTAFLARRICGDEIARVHGIIPVAPAQRTFTDGALLVGDAAGQAKPTSGGGLYTGGVCARIAGQIAARAALAGDTGKETLSEYERCWHDKIGRELRFGRVARAAIADMDDDGINSVFDIVNTPQVLNMIAEHGDIDRPSLLAHAIASERRLWPTLAPLISILGGREKLAELAHAVVAVPDDDFV